MDKKNKDCVFALGLIALAAYVIYESRNMLARAALPPFNIKAFGISPGMLPMVLGWVLMLFSVILLITSLRGSAGGMLAALGDHIAKARYGFRAALADRDVRSMTVCTCIMFVYSFFLLGLRVGDWQMPFWLGAGIFLITIMTYLRASKLWIIVLSSGLSIAAVMVLFQTIFKTSLP